MSNALSTKKLRIVVTISLALLMLCIAIILLMNNSIPIMGGMVNYYDEYKLKREISKNPYSAEAHYKLGQLYFDQGKVDKMEVEFKKALALNPKSISTIYSLGNHYEAKYQFQKALVLYKSGAQHDTEYNLPFYGDMGRMYHNLDMPAKALCAYEKALRHIGAYDFIISGKENIKKNLESSIVKLRRSGIIADCQEVLPNSSIQGVQ